MLKTDAEVAKLGQLIREYFKLGGHHIQFNIVDTETLCDAQQRPDEYRDLLVRVAGYSDYFNDMTAQLQNEIIARTENDDLEPWQSCSTSSGTRFTTDRESGRPFS